MANHRRLLQGAVNPKKNTFLRPFPTRIPKRAFKQGYPDIVKFIYNSQPFQLRLSVSLLDIQEILGLTYVQAWEVANEIRTMPWKSKYSFISVKDLANYMKVSEGEVQYYFYALQGD
jgi:hypothetical protein